MNIKSLFEEMIVSRRITKKTFFGDQNRNGSDNHKFHRHLNFLTIFLERERDFLKRLRIEFQFKLFEDARLLLKLRTSIEIANKLLNLVF